MSLTRIFKIGTAEIHQGKPSEETRRALRLMHKANTEKAEELAKKQVDEISDLLKDKSSADLSVVINEIIRQTNIKQTA